MMVNARRGGAFCFKLPSRAVGRFPRKPQGRVLTAGPPFCVLQFKRRPQCLGLLTTTDAACQCGGHQNNAGAGRGAFPLQAPRPAFNRGAFLHAPVQAPASVSWFIEYPRRGVPVRESPALLISRKQHSRARWHNEVSLTRGLISDCV